MHFGAQGGEFATGGGGHVLDLLVHDLLVLGRGFGVGQARAHGEHRAQGRAAVQRRLAKHV